MVVDNEEEPMEGVPLEQYRAWLGEKDLEVGKLGFSLYLLRKKGCSEEGGNFECPSINWNKLGFPIYKQLALQFSFTDEDSNLSPSPLRDLTGGLGGQEEEEEQRWLDALEKGELDDNGDLKKEINERLLTARQVNCFILYTCQYVLQTFQVLRTLPHSGDISGEKRQTRLLCSWSLYFCVCVCVCEGVNK